MTTSVYKAIIVTALLFGVSLATAGERSWSTVATFLDVPPGGRIAGIFVAASLADDSYSSYVNPAGLGYMVDNPELAYMFQPAPGGGLYSYYGALWAPFNLSIMTFDAGEMEVLELNENPRTLRAQRDTAYSLGWGTHYGETLFAGANAKFVTSTLAETYAASAFLADAGLLWRSLDDRLSFGAVFRNVFTAKLRYYSMDEPLPSDILMGGTLRVPLVAGNSLLLGADYSVADKQARYGLEMTLLEAAAARVGYAEGKDPQVTLGAGIKTWGSPRISLDYAFNLFVANALKTGHNFSLSLRFGGVGPQDKAKSYEKKKMKRRAALWKQVAEQTRASLPGTLPQAESSKYAPLLYYLYPDHGPVGKQVKIVGAKFVPERTKVSFGGVKAEVISASHDFLVVRVPQVKKIGRLRVVIDSPGAGTSNVNPFLVEISTPPFLKTYNVAVIDGDGDGVVSSTESAKIVFKLANLLGAGEALNVKVKPGVFDPRGALSCPRLIELGDILPGTEKTVEIPIEVNPDVDYPEATVAVDFEEFNGNNPEQLLIKVPIRGNK